MTVPLWWWLPGFGLAALIALEVVQGVSGVPTWAPFAVLLPVAAATLVWMGRIELRVVSTGTGPDAETELWVGPAHIPTGVELPIETSPSRNLRLTRSRHPEG